MEEIRLLVPDRTCVMKAMDRRQAFLVFAVINAVFIVADILMFSTGRYPFSYLVIAVVAVRNCIASIRNAKLEASKVNDLTKGRIELDGDNFYCIQAAENGTYEICTMHLGEVAQILESRDKGKPGFYITLTKERYSSKITEDNRVVDRDLFYVNGFGYDLKEFREMYLEILKKLPEGVGLSVTKNQYNWKEISIRDEMISMLLPWLAVFVTADIHLVIYIICY